ncbi:phenylacetate-CoA oxygenase subunit PaaC [Streptomyces lonarensis]|uniref:Phenylacetate-CoA oxygenase subunit PaaC n=2 Tax=Streptomyces lonarensis TaxID=700599 RepID=A0A7X6I0Z1_9ACTN|nr:1,2-phenylacetyl-CoA epoxidase subunit PaaC [Streptomyces lonarensis]NJQ08025.1 phenylacetate-CoA oxygenase subunit PaaC [Streptomyces lonarensis]
MLGDDALILSHRLAEWTGHAPALEEDVALANISLDLLGQARTLFSLVGDEDELAYLRGERDFRNVQLVEQPNGDFAHTIARQLYFSLAQEIRYTAVVGTDGCPTPIRELAAKAVKETAYHRDHATEWTLRLGDGTDESHARMRRGLEVMWRHTGELFAAVPGLPLDDAALRENWLTALEAVLGEATLPLPQGPDADAWTAGGGREGIHTEPFGFLLAEMQHLHRSHPGATW